MFELFVLANPDKNCVKRKICIANSLYCNFEEDVVQTYKQLLHYDETQKSCK